MPKRSQIKRVTAASRALRFLREQAGLSLRAAAGASGVGDGVITHLENGRIEIHPHHLQKLLPAYGTTPTIFELFAKGKVALPENLRHDCIEIIKSLPIEQLRTAHPVLVSLTRHQKGE